MSSPVSVATQDDLRAAMAQPMLTGVGRSLAHESAAKHVTGEALFVDDRLELSGQLHVAPRLSERAHARILRIDTTGCYLVPGVILAITAADVPGELDIGAVFPGDPLLASESVQYVGQAVAAVAATSFEAARAGAAAIAVEYEDIAPILGIETALANENFVSPTHTHRRGNAQEALARAPHRLQGQMHVGGQEHFYLETQISVAVPTEDGGMMMYSSCQHPTELQKLVAQVLGIDMHKVTVDMRRMGGGFGGKETQFAGPACMAAVVALLTRRPAKMRLSRFEDMVMTGKRHPFFNQYEVGFDDTGRIHGIELKLAGDCGYSPDLSNAIVDRAMFHADNAYYLGDATIHGHRCKSNTASNTAFRGFGGPQGMIMPEVILDDIARTLKKDPLEVRKANFYGGEGRNVTHYYQTVEDNIAPELVADLEKTSDYQARRAQIALFNAASPVLKKGIALTPVKFGISFTATFLNQGGALIHIYTDGSILLNHGGCEMGQGLNVKVAQIVAEEFQVGIEHIQVTATRTDKVPNTSPTAASAGTDLNGKAAQNAAQIIKARLTAFAARHFAVTEDDVVFRNNHVCAGETIMAFPAFVQLAYFNQVSLSSTGFYRTPKIHYDRATGRGRPFFYYAYGAACSEVLIDTLTGENRVTRVDILHDVGVSLNPAIDIGQVEGAFIQGMGWLTTEELVWNERGRLLSSGPSTYKIPAISDTPPEFYVRLVENHSNREDTVYQSKAVGEPPLMLAISVFCALRDAVASLSEGRFSPKLDAPATPERVFWACEAMRQSCETSP